CKEKNSAPRLRSLLRSASAPEPDQCWRLTRVSAEGCLVASPCVASGASSTKALPLAANTPEKIVAEGDTILLCQPNLQKIHQLKDPDNAQLEYNLAFANFLAFGRSSPKVPFRPANCHGTAQAILGGFLDKAPVTAVGFHSPQVKEVCGPQAMSKFSQ